MPFISFVFNFDKRIRGEQYGEKMLYMPLEYIPSKHLKVIHKFELIVSRLVKNYIDF